MKLNEISFDLVGEMLDKFPIKSLLTFKKNKELNYSFHIDLLLLKGWYKVSENSEAIKFYQTKKGIIYFFLDENILCFLKPCNKSHTYKKVIISVNFSSGFIKNDYTEFLLKNGVEYYTKKFICFDEKGKIVVGRWVENYKKIKL